MSALSDLQNTRYPPNASVARCMFDVQQCTTPNTRCHPFMLPELQSGTPSNLLGLVLAVLEIQDHTSRVLPMLIDEKIHYSIMKMMYSVSYHEYNVGHKLCRTPPPPV